MDWKQLPRQRHEHAEECRCHCPDNYTPSHATLPTVGFTTNCQCSNWKIRRRLIHCKSVQAAGSRADIVKSIRHPRICLSPKPLRGAPQWACPRNPLARIVAGMPELASSLHVQPELRTVAKHAGKDQRGRGGHVPAVVAELVYPLALDTHRLGPGGVRDGHKAHVLFYQDLG